MITEHTIILPNPESACRRGVDQGYPFEEPQARRQCQSNQEANLPSLAANKRSTDVPKSSRHPGYTIISALIIALTVGSPGLPDLAQHHKLSSPSVVPKVQ